MKLGLFLNFAQEYGVPKGYVSKKLQAGLDAGKIVEAYKTRLQFLKLVPISIQVYTRRSPCHYLPIDSSGQIF